MNKVEKLKLVFDFIADYLSEDEGEVKHYDKKEVNSEDYTLTENEDKYKRAYSIMKKIDDIDKKKAEIKEELEPLKKEIKRIKSEYEKMINTEPVLEAFKEKTGVTVSEDGKITEVKIGNLRDYIPINDVLYDTNTKDKNIATSVELKSVDVKNIIDKENNKK